MKKQKSHKELPSFEAIGKQLGLSRNRTEQIYESAIRKLRFKMDRDTLREIVAISNKYE